MCLHRLLQRGYKQLYGYKLPSTTTLATMSLQQGDANSLPGSEYSEAILVAENLKDLELQNARCASFDSYFRMFSFCNEQTNMYKSHKSYKSCYAQALSFYICH